MSVYCVVSFKVNKILAFLCEQTYRPRYTGRGSIDKEVVCYEKGVHIHLHDNCSFFGIVR